MLMKCDVANGYKSQMRLLKYELLSAKFEGSQQGAKTDFSAVVAGLARCDKVTRSGEVLQSDVDGRPTDAMPCALSGHVCTSFVY